MEIKIGGLYRHVKSDKLYKVLAIAKHSETLADLVIYEAQYENKTSKVWARPIEMFAPPRFILETQK